MTTLLPSQDLATLRAIARTSAVLLVCLRIDQLHPGRAIADFEIADILEQDPRTVKRQLRSLSAAGLMISVRGKWLVTAAGRNTLFGREAGGGSEVIVAEVEDAAEAVNQLGPAGKSDYEKITQNVYYEKNAQNVHNSHNQEEGAHKEADFQAGILNYEKNAQNVLLMNDEEDIKSINDSESSSSIIERANCARILEATSLLFGSAVGTKGITDRDPDVALAWIGKAWNDRKTLRSPQGLIYKRLAENEQPPSGWLDDPCFGLPEEYLRAVGRWTEPEQVEVDVDAQPAPRRVDVWRDVARAMGGKIKHVEFSSWEESWWQGDMLQVAVRARRVCDFNRMAAGMAGEILSSMVGRSVQVQFVPAETES